MNPVEELLTRVPQVNGLVGVALVDALTGRVLAGPAVPGAPGDEAGQAAVPLVAAATTDIVAALSLLAAQAQVPGDLEDLMITFSDHYHLVRPLAGPDGTPLVLLLTLDRARANLALARHQLRAFEPDGA